jgi:hypothetical protein
MAKLENIIARVEAFLEALRVLDAKSSKFTNIHNELNT